MCPAATVVPNDPKAVVVAVAKYTDYGSSKHL